MGIEYEKMLIARRVAVAVVVMSVTLAAVEGV